MLRTRIGYTMAALLLTIYFCGPTALAGTVPEQIVLQANEIYTGTVDVQQTRYLRLKLSNLSETASTLQIAFLKDKIELGADRVGPVEFRTFTLEKPKESQTRTWTTLTFDAFTLEATQGIIQAIVEKSMDVQ